MKKNLIFFSFSLIFLAGCAGFPKTINIEKKGTINFVPESLKLVINKSPGLEKIIVPETIKRIESLFNEKLAGKNITLNANSQITLKILIEKYDDGNVLGRGITGAIFGINIGEPAKIEGQITISENQKEITKANISVESSRSGWNFSHGYSGAKGMEKGFVEEATKILFEPLAD